MENELIQFGESHREKGKTSLEIAKKIGRKHQHVMRDIRAILDQGVDASNFGLITYTDNRNRQQPCYELTPKGMLILASGYDAKLRVKMSRPSKKEEKEFWVITEKGLEFGENTISPENPKETQPNWYDSHFKELLSKIGIIPQQNLFQL